MLKLSKYLNRCLSLKCTDCGVSAQFFAFLAETLTVLPRNHSENSLESEFLTMLKERVNFSRLFFCRELFMN